STWRTISGTARAAASLFTVTRTSSLPAACSARTWATVPATSAVSVLVMDWTTMGRSPPTRTPPTSTTTLFRRREPLMVVILPSRPRAPGPQPDVPARGLPGGVRHFPEGSVGGQGAERAVGLELIVVEELVPGGLVGESRIVLLVVENRGGLVADERGLEHHQETGLRRPQLRAGIGVQHAGVTDDSERMVGLGAPGGGVEADVVEVDVHRDVLVDIDLAQRLREGAEGVSGIGLGITGHDDGAPALEQRADAEIVAGMAAVGDIDEAAIGVGGAQHLAQEIERPEHAGLGAVGAPAAPEAGILQPLAQPHVQEGEGEGLGEEGLVSHRRRGRRARDGH